MKTAGFFASVILVAIGCARPAPVVANASDTEARLRRLEEQLAKYAEALDFLGKVYEQQKQQSARAAEEEQDPTAMFAVAIANDLALGKVDGPASAPVTIIKAFDFACPYCQRTASIMDELVTEYAGKVRVVYKDLVVHPDIAMPAHLAACAAAKQGKYKLYKTAIWDKGFTAYASSRDPSKLDDAHLEVLAKDAGLDVKRFDNDKKSAECKVIVEADMAELEKFKVNATPGFFINGKFIGGALPKDGFKLLIDEQLKIAEASGVAGADYYDKVVLAKGEKKFKSAVAR
jgi:protein-disulfide isomerase